MPVCRGQWRTTAIGLDVDALYGQLFRRMADPGPGTRYAVVGVHWLRAGISYGLVACWCARVSAPAYRFLQRLPMSQQCGSLLITVRLSPRRLSRHWGRMTWWMTGNKSRNGAP